MNVRFDDAEIACVKGLAELFEKGVFCISHDEEKELNLPPEKRDAILTTMEDMGIIKDAVHVVEGRFMMYNICSQAVQTARAIREQEKEGPMDIVEQVKLTIRQKPLTAWAIIIFLGLTALFVFLHNLFGVLKDLGIID